jgi:hypothetical protein
VVGLRHDTVTAGLTLPWNSAIVEGQHRYVGIVNHEPLESTGEVKAAVTVVVRKSLLEEVHTNGPLNSGGWRRRRRR